MIRVTNQLTEKERKAAKALIASCQAYDQTFREPYLSNMLNFDPNMPAFFLYYQEGELIGLLTVYADDHDVEVAILVAPDYRRKGIARSLFDKFQKETAPYPFRSVTFQTERVFLDSHPDLESHWGVVEDEETETWLGRDRTPYALDSRSDVKVLLAAPALNLCSLINWLPIFHTKNHGCLSRAIMTNGLDLINLIRQKQKVFRTFKEIVLKIIFETKSHHWNI